jgi:hypothetical protein
MQRKSDRQKMIDFIARQLPHGEATMVLASGDDGDVTAHVVVLYDEAEGYDLEIESDFPEWTTLRDVYDYLRWESMPAWEQLKWLQVPLRPTLSGKSEFIPPDKGEGSWCNSAASDPPPSHPFGPLLGTQKQLATWLFNDDVLDHRRLHGKAQRGVVWVRAVHSRLYETWFRTEREYGLAVKRKAEAQEHA